MTNSRTKGSKNERSVAKVLKSWTGFDFTRVPSSGGLRWKRTSDTCGDIICADQKHSRYFTFSVEVKAYKDINFEHLLQPNIKLPKILDFWNQCCDDAQRAGKLPILFMRYDNLPKDFFFVVVSHNYFKDVMGYLVEVPMERLMNVITSTEEVRYALTILTTTELIKLDYQRLHKLNKKYIKSNGLQRS